MSYFLIFLGATIMLISTYKIGYIIGYCDGSYKDYWKCEKCHAEQIILLESSKKEQSK